MKLINVISAGVLMAATVGHHNTYALDLGRLFYSASERAAFERARRETVVETEVEIVEPEIAIAPQSEVVEEIPAPMITVDGYVRRSDGNETIWVNGANNYDGDLSAAKVDSKKTKTERARVKLQPMGSGKAVMMKPGQSYDPNTATMSDAYEWSPLAAEPTDP